MQWEIILSIWSLILSSWSQYYNSVFIFAAKSLDPILILKFYSSLSCFLWSLYFCCLHILSYCCSTYFYISMIFSNFNPFFLDLWTNSTLIKRWRELRLKGHLCVCVAEEKTREGLALPQGCVCLLVCAHVHVCATPGLEQTGQRVPFGVRSQGLSSSICGKQHSGPALSTALSLSSVTQTHPPGLGQEKAPALGVEKELLSAHCPLPAQAPPALAMVPIKTHMWRQWAVMAGKANSWELKMQTVQEN